AFKWFRSTKVFKNPCEGRVTGVWSRPSHTKKYVFALMVEFNGVVYCAATNLSSVKNNPWRESHLSQDRQEAEINKTRRFRREVMFLRYFLSRPSQQ
ncbi:unnamed protein product, partial [Nesidiocoris tenuis]